jgi:adenylate kinase family enzyme
MSGISFSGEEKVCGFCGGPLTARTDDRPDHFRARLEAFREQANLLKTYYHEVPYRFVSTTNLSTSQVIQICDSFVDNTQEVRDRGDR